MGNYYKNLKSAMNKLKKNQMVAGNQLVFKEKEALILTGTFISIPIIAAIVAMIGTIM